MRARLDSIYNIIVDRSPQEWVVGIGIALLLALALVGVYMLCRRWLKVTDSPAPLAALAIVAIFTGMTIAAVYVHSSLRGRDAPSTAGAGGAGRGPGGGQAKAKGGGGGGQLNAFTKKVAERIVANADTDKDGLVSPDEAGTAAAAFIKEADVKEKGGLDSETLLTAIRERGRAGGGAPPQPGGPAAKSGGTPPAPGGPAEKSAESAPAPRPRS